MGLAIFSLFALTIFLNFPYDSDELLTAEKTAQAQKYYGEAYRKESEKVASQAAYDTQYLHVAESAAKDRGIESQVRTFVDQYALAGKQVLEIGSGRGYLQDMVSNYTGLDISPAVARFYHKQFVVGSATAMPFADNSFDAIWTIWVFEHVINPEQAFVEARRVTRDQGLIFLLPAWNAPSWAAEGYQVRPYSDFGIVGKAIKSTVGIRATGKFTFATVLPVRIVRAAFTQSAPTKLRYRRLTPNYEIYWMGDSDAVNSIDSHEALLWFTSRGDECLNCGDYPILFPVAHEPLIIRVHKGNT